MTAQANPLTPAQMPDQPTDSASARVGQVPAAPTSPVSPAADFLPLKLYKNGFTDLISVVPPDATISPGSKLLPIMLGNVPGRRNKNGTWGGYPWQEAEHTVDDVREWMLWGANVGLRADHLPGLDIDSEDQNIAAQVERMALAHFGDAPVRYGRRPKRLLMYATDVPFGRMRVWGVPRTGKVYLEYRDHQGRKARNACGHRDFASAKAQADEMAAQLRHPDRRRVGASTLAELFDNYLREVTPTKGGSKQAHDRRTAALVLEILGPARRAAELTHRDAARFVAERRRRGDRRTGARRGQPLRARALQYDVAWLKAVLVWAVGAGLLDRNPFLGYVPPAEASPRRPIVTASEYEALLATSDPIHPLFRLALIVVHETGHRIGAVRLLRWADIDLEHQLVRWRRRTTKSVTSTRRGLRPRRSRLSKPHADHSR